MERNAAHASARVVLAISLAACVSGCGSAMRPGPAPVVAATTTSRAVLARLVALPLPTPNPYSGWPSRRNETGDSIRTPPRWPVLVTQDPRSEWQPRMLFAAANVRAALPDHLVRDFPPDGVQVRVVEERHGAASAGFPPFPNHAWPAPGDFHAVTTDPEARAAGLVSERATAERLGSRFSVWIVRGADSTAADRAWARGAASSVGLSAGAFRSHPRQYTVKQLEYALRTNPNNEASIASCRRLSHPRRHSPLSPPPTFSCRIAVNGNPAATFDVQVLPNGCFVAERRRPGQADYGCIRR